MSGLFLGILCITKRGYQFRSFDSLAPSTSSTHLKEQIEQRIIGSYGYNDEDLGEKARKAKQRLDQRLRRSKSKEERFKDVENEQVESNNLQKKEMAGMKQNGIKTFSRVIKQWKDIENDECTICLGQFKVGDNLMHLQCDHKFHSCCLVPLLENYAYCPCCRMDIVT
ncbi:probable E3 ubiquitin-protein ligase RHY1A [Solanum dulcamara]|uniref:probable E3 ubiquitin-protein ligase RHY1A n=1 Tax=Solanum dulcamara TaxID=45834 RepID=UPI00248620F1|nr:probable E3 ubiquitin-protein ligase RHY1A [Solanum dulcamara]